MGIWEQWKICLSRIEQYYFSSVPTASLNNRVDSTTSRSRSQIEQRHKYGHYNARQ